jgi:hypothetical protein
MINYRKLLRTIRHAPFVVASFAPIFVLVAPTLIVAAEMRTKSAKAQNRSDKNEKMLQKRAFWKNLSIARYFVPTLGAPIRPTHRNAKNSFDFHIRHEKKTG